MGSELRCTSEKRGGSGTGGGCDMEGERHLLSIHADIEATINSATEHFLFGESFREEQ